MKEEKGSNVKRDISKAISPRDIEHFTKYVIRDLKGTSAGRAMLKGRTKEEVIEMLNNPANERNVSTLREISNQLYYSSQEYSRLINYLASLGSLDHIITPAVDLQGAVEEGILEEGAIRESYVSLALQLSKMNIKNEITDKVMVSLLLNGVYFGYIYDDKRAFQIQKLPVEYCRITSVEDGVYNFGINMNMVKSNINILDSLPKSFRRLYDNWLIEKEKDRDVGDYVELNKRKTICLRVENSTDFDLPAFAGVFADIFDLRAYKKLRLSKTELDNYMLLLQKLPMRKESDANNDFLIEGGTYKAFTRILMDVAPENVGVVTSPMDIEAVRFDKDSSDKDNVSKASRDYWSSTGTSQHLFNSDSSTSKGLDYSIKTDEMYIFGIVRGFERWLNRYVRLKRQEFSLFNVKILETSPFNKMNEVFKMVKESGQYGVPLRTMLGALNGLTPIELIANPYLENDILGLDKAFKPLMSSHTMSGKDFAESGVAEVAEGEAGRPALSMEEKGDEAMRTVDKES